MRLLKIKNNQYKNGIILSIIIHSAAALVLVIGEYNKEEFIPNEIELTIVHKISTPISKPKINIKNEPKLKEKKTVALDKDETEAVQIYHPDSLHLTNLKVIDNFTPYQPNIANTDNYWLKKLDDDVLFVEYFKKNPNVLSLKYKVFYSKNKDKYINAPKYLPFSMDYKQFMYSDGFHNGKMNNGGVSVPISDMVETILDLF